MRQLVDRSLVSEDRAVRDSLGPQMPKRTWHVTKTEGIFPERSLVDLEFDQVADGAEGVAEEVARALHRAEEIADHRKAATLDALEVKRRPARLVNTPVDGGGFQVRVDLLLDAHELPRT